MFVIKPSGSHSYNAMRIFLIVLITSMLLTACQTENHTRELKLSDFIFEAKSLGDECSLAVTTAEGETKGNPVLSSEHEYVKNVTSQWVNEELASSARTILISVYQGEDESGGVGLFGIGFNSKSAANSAAKLLKREHPKESCNVIYQEDDIVIWLWQDNDRTNECFKKLQDLVEKEIREAGLDILKHF